MSGDLVKVQAMENANWIPAAQYWREKAEALQSTLAASEVSHKAALNDAEAAGYERGLREVVKARQCHRDAVAIYNAKLVDVTMMREVDDWSGSVQDEYAAMQTAQREFIAVSQSVADAAILAMIPTKGASK